MSGEKIVRALDAIPDEQLQSAMSVYERRKKLKYIWVRVVIALILLAVVVWLLATSTTSVVDEHSSPEGASAQTDTVMKMQKGTAKMPFLLLFS